MSKDATEERKSLANAIALTQSEEFARHTNDWYIQVHKEGDQVIRDLDHLYHEFHTLVRWQIAKEIMVAIEAMAEKAKRPMYEARPSGLVLQGPQQDTHQEAPIIDILTIPFQYWRTELHSSRKG